MIESVYCATPPQSQRASQRLGGVWSDQHNSQLFAEKMKDASSLVPKVTESRAKRLEASDWILHLTGASIPHQLDMDFRGSLRDGLLLCKVLNAVCPGSIHKILEPPESQRSELSQRYENVTNFLAATSAMGVPPMCTCTASDLDSESREERPRVVDCVLWLKRLHEGVSPMAPFSPFSPLISMEDNDIAPMRDSAQKPMGMMKALSPMRPPFEFASSAMQHTHHTKQEMQMQSSNVTQLMQQCSDMLHERMFSSVTTTTMTKSTKSVEGGDFNFESVGPVLESVLGNLTQEYERRLLLKDQEIISTKEKMSGLARQMVELQTQISSMRQELMAQQEEAAVHSNAANADQLQSLQAAVTELQAALAEREALLRLMSEGVEEEAGAAAAREMELSTELDSMRDQLAGVERLEQQYRSVQEENRKLYNTVQDLKGSIRVFCRVRPLGITGVGGNGCLNVDVDGEELAIYEGGKSARKVFKFDRIFDSNCTQAEVYGDAQQLIRSVLDGYNVCIFAYGQTGAGKTHTMSGTNVHDMEGRGINYRALDDLFELQEKRTGEVEYTIRVQMLEVYNETLRDLLAEDQSLSGNRLDILNTQASGCNVPGATQMEVRCPQDVVDMMTRGARNRRSAETKMNERSSRSHQVLTVIVDGYNQLTHARSHGCLHLVDLAGSERVGKSEATGDRMVEAQHINKSLSALGDVMSALASKDKHVPFRNSKLTQLLADSLSGNAKVLMFMHASPEASSYSETLGTLKFATRVAEVTLGKAKKNVECSKAIMAEEEVSRLRDEVANSRARLHEETRDRELLQHEIEALRAELDAARMVATSPSMRLDAARMLASSPWGSDVDDESLLLVSQGAPPHTAASAQPTLKFLNLVMNGEASSTPPFPSSRGATSSRYGGNYGQKKPAPITPSASLEGSRLPAFLPPTPKTPQSGGSLTARGDVMRRTSATGAGPLSSSALNSSRPANCYSARPGNVYSSASGLPKPQPSPVPTSLTRQLSMRSGGVHVPASSSSSTASFCAPPVRSSAGSITARSSGLVMPQSAGGRRSLSGGWKS